jgi:hypothetical protein
VKEEESAVQIGQAFTQLLFGHALQKLVPNVKRSPRERDLDFRAFANLSNVLLQKPSDVRGIGWRRDSRHRLRLSDLGRCREDGAVPPRL